MIARLAALTAVSAAAAALAVAGVAHSVSAAGAPGPFTAPQAAAGAKAYADNCSRCHGAQLQGVSAPALHGAGSGLAGDTVNEAYTFISTQMPAGAPGSLTTQQYTQIVAFILSKNGHAPGKAMLTPASAKSSKLKV